MNSLTLPQSVTDLRNSSSSCQTWRKYALNAENLKWTKASTLVLATRFHTPLHLHLSSNSVHNLDLMMMSSVPLPLFHLWPSTRCFLLSWKLSLPLMVSAFFLIHSWLMSSCSCCIVLILILRWVWFFWLWEMLVFIYELQSWQRYSWSCWPCCMWLPIVFFKIRQL